MRPIGEGVCIYINPIEYVDYNLKISLKSIKQNRIKQNVWVVCNICTCQAVPIAFSYTCANSCILFYSKYRTISC